MDFDKIKDERFITNGMCKHEHKASCCLVCNPPEEKKDKGHELLVEDIRAIYDDVMKYEFHDFKNDKYALPKMELINKLSAMRKSIFAGKYDN